MDCACEWLAERWIDAGCKVHGVRSGIGLWDFYDEMEKMRRAIIPDIQMRRKANVKWD